MKISFSNVISARSTFHCKVCDVTVWRETKVNSGVLAFKAGFQTLIIRALTKEKLRFGHVQK